MTSVLVDTNVILDLLTPSQWTEWSLGRIAELADDFDIAINQIVYSEASARYADIVAFDSELNSAGFVRTGLSWEGAFAAGKAHVDYRRRGGARERTLPDFLIGAHASAMRYKLLTRDAGRYRSYFPDLEIISPETHP